MLITIAVINLLVSTVRIESQPIRLVGGSGPREGRVEVFHDNTWGTVCDDNWGGREASVVCRQLGFSPTGAVGLSESKFGQGTGKIWLDNVYCQVSDMTLAECSHAGWGEENCDHTEDASVICEDVALVGGSNAMEGRVQILHNGSFRRVCRDGFGQEEARVVCRHLGFNSDELDPAFNVDFGKGSGPGLVAKIDCKGTESSLTDCKVPEFTFGECSDNHDASVNCKFVPLRLVNGSGPHEGRVEVHVEGNWKTVCDDYLDDKGASVVCRQLGYSGTGAISKGEAYFGWGRGNIVAIQCNGKEEYLTDCTYGRATLCGHYEDASVICSETSQTTTTTTRGTTTTTIPTTTTTRLTTITTSPPTTATTPTTTTTTPITTTTIPSTTTTTPVTTTTIATTTTTIPSTTTTIPTTTSIPTTTTTRLTTTTTIPTTTTITTTTTTIPTTTIPSTTTTIPTTTSIPTTTTTRLTTTTTIPTTTTTIPTTTTTTIPTTTTTTIPTTTTTTTIPTTTTTTVPTTTTTIPTTTTTTAPTTTTTIPTTITTTIPTTTTTTVPTTTTTIPTKTTTTAPTTTTTIVGSPPKCKPGVHEFEYNIKTADLRGDILCLDIGSFDNSSWCSDDEDSLIFSIDEDPFGFFHLFELEINKEMPKSCLQLKAPDRIQVAKARLTIIAKEDSAQGRTATLSIIITFNRPPTVTHRIINWITNIAKLGALDVIKQSQAEDSDSITLTSVYYQENGVVSGTIKNNMLQLNLVNTGTTFDLRRMQVQIKMSDDGIPSLSTNVTVQIVIVRLECTSTDKMPVNIGELQSVKTLPIGQINCAVSRGYQILYDVANTALQQGHELRCHDGIVSIVQGDVITIRSKTEDVVVNVTMVQFPSIHVNVTFQIEFAFYGLMWFQSKYISWTRELIDKSSNEYRNAAKNITDMISEVVDRSVTVDIVQFRQDSWVDVQLAFPNQAVFKETKSLLLDRNDSVISGSHVEFNNRSSHIFAPRVNILNKTKHTLGGDTVEIFCEADVINSIGPVSVEWTLDGAGVRPLLSSRFQISTGIEFPWRLRSTLTITHITMIDQGKIQCHVSDLSGYRQFGSITLIIISPPTVGVPDTQFVRRNANINLKCEVLKPENIPTTLMWLHNGLNIQNGSELNTIVTNDGNFTCVGSNIAGLGKGNSTKIIIIKGPLSCPRDIDARGTYWSEAAPDAKAEQSCPSGYSGSVSRYCNNDGKWLTGDYSLCIQASLINIKNQIEQVKAGIVVSEPDKLLANLTKITKQSTLEKTEILQMTSAIKTLTQITDETTQNSSTAQNKTKQFAKESVILVSTLFDREQASNMETLEYENSSISHDLMDSMEKVGELVGDNLPDGKSETIQSENIVLSVGKTDPFNMTDVNFPGDIDTVIKTNAQLPKEIFQSSSDLNTVTYSIISYKSIPNLPMDTDRNLTTDDVNSSTTYGVNSEILAINVYGQDTSKLKSDIVLTFYHLNTNLGNAACSYLDPSNVWSSQGCKVVDTNQNLTVCSCDHLTNFALLMKPTKGSVSEYILHHYEVLSTITIIGCSISLVCLTITLVIFIAVWRFVQCTRTIILVNLCVALIVALLLFLLGVDKTYNKDLCTGIAVGLHFFYLVVFYLMLAEGMEILLTIINVFNSLSKLREVGLLLFAWGIPLMIVVTSASVTRFQGYGNKNFCWLSIKGGLIWAFIAPALVVILVNVMIVVKIIHAMLTTRVMITKDTRDKAKAAVRSICVLLPVMGVSWGFGILAVNEDWILFDYIFTILNTLQGLFIFIFHCVLNKKVREGLAIHHRRYRSRHTSLSGPSSSRSMSEIIRRKSSVGLTANSPLRAFIKFNTSAFAGSNVTGKNETSSGVPKSGETIAEIHPGNRNDPDDMDVPLDNDHAASAAAIDMEIGIKPRREGQPSTTAGDDNMKTQYYIPSSSTIHPTMESEIDFIDD